jgi:hypothetical protein
MFFFSYNFVKWDCLCRYYANACWFNRCMLFFDIFEFYFIFYTNIYFYIVEA